MWSWLRGVVRRTRVERDLATELEFHLHSRTEHWIAQGLSPGQAARRARLEFGRLETCKDECRQALGVRLIDELRADLAYGLRKMTAAPTFTIVVVAILALTVGANVAVFSVIDAVLLRRLPVERPEQLRELAWIDRRDANLRVKYSGGMRPLSSTELLATSFAYPVYAHVRDHSTVFADLFVFERRAITVRVGDSRQRIVGLVASGNFLPGLGVTMTLGRSIVPDDDRVDAPAVAVLSHAYWQRMFGSDPAALGRTIAIEGTPAVIVGVTSRGFEGVEPGAPVDVMLPLTSLLAAIGQSRDVLTNPRYWRFPIMGRVKAGVDDERVLAETSALVRQAIVDGMPDTGPQRLPRVVVSAAGQGLDGLRRTYARPLYLLLAIMFVVLVIACANVAGLLLMRATSREGEMGVRLALGAGRARLVRQLLTESGLLVSVGGGLGIGLAFVARGGLLPMLEQGAAPSVSLGLGGWTVLFSLGLCLAVALLCGMLPALRAPRLGLAATRVVPGAHAGKPRLLGAKALIAVQVALSLVLLIGGGLFLRTLANLRAQPIGFRADHVLLFELDAAVGGYEGARLGDFHQRVLDRVSGIPDVRAVSLSRYALLSGGRTTDTIVVPGAPAGQEEIRVHLHFVSPRYLETMGIALLAGRDFTGQDREGAARVALANQALAQLLPGSEPPLGRRILYARPDSGVEIVGVIADARLATLRDPAPPTLYLPYRQYPQARPTFAIRTAGDPLAVAGPIRRAIAEIDSNVPPLAIRTQDAQIDAGVRRERLFALVASGFAGLALSLACVGIYGTLTYSVARRTREIGLRMALGAGRRQVVSMVIRESLLPVAVGVVFGLGAVAAATRFIESMLFGVTAHDGPTFALATLGLAASAALAAWLPSHRASGVDPMTALRSE